MSDAENWMQYDLAKSTLLNLIGYYSKVVYEEQHKPLPNLEKIAKWEDEKDSLRILSERLDPTDQVATTQIYAKYAPLLRAVRGKE